MHLVVRILHGDSGSHSGRLNAFSFFYFTSLHSFISSLVHSVSHSVARPSPGWDESLGWTNGREAILALMSFMDVAD